MVIDKGGIVNKIVSDLKHQEYDRIESNILGFKSPSAIGIKNSDKGYYPDIVGYKDEKVDVFSIETKIDTKISKKDMERWRLFRIYAKINHGNLFLACTPSAISLIKQKISPIPSNLKFIQLI